MTDAAEAVLATDADAILLCRVRSLVCALPVIHVIETMRPLPVDAFGGAPDFVVGIARVRGEHLPVVDLGRVLGLTEEPSTARFVLLRVATRSVALAVEAVLGVESLGRGRAHTFPPLLKEAQDGVIAALRDRDSELLLVLNTARLISGLPEGRA